MYIVAKGLDELEKARTKADVKKAICRLSKTCGRQKIQVYRRYKELEPTPESREDRGFRIWYAFSKVAKKKLPKGTEFDCCWETNVSKGEKPYVRGDVSVPCGICSIGDAEKEILKIAKETGLLEEFDNSGAGYGFGMRDVGFCQK